VAQLVAFALALYEPLAQGVHARSDVADPAVET